MPFVFCTSTYHHGTKTEPVCWYARNKGIVLVDLDHAEEEFELELDWKDPLMKDSEVEEKAWKSAYSTLAEAIVCKEFGIRRMTSMIENPEARKAERARYKLLTPKE